MTSDLRVVVDTNVLISQLLRPQSQPADAKFDAYVPADVRVSQIRQLAALAEPVRIVRKVRLCRDPKDDMLLEIAANGRASHLVTGDADLLRLDPFDGVRIVTPAAFLLLARLED